MAIKERHTANHTEDYKAHYERILEQLDNLPTEVETALKRKIKEQLAPVIRNIEQDASKIPESMESSRLQVNIKNLMRVLKRESLI